MSRVDPLENFSDTSYLYERQETWFSFFCNLINPLSYARYFYATLFRTFRVCGTFINITPRDFVSGIILGVLMGAFAAVYAATIFDEADLDDYIGLGGGLQMVPIVITGISHVFFSDVGISISSPDLNPAIFFGWMAINCRDNVKGSALSTNSTVNQQVILTSTLTCIIISTIGLGLILLFIGRFHLTRALQMLPDPVLTGFMAAFGYLIIHKAFRTSIPVDVWQSGPGNPLWWQFAAPAVAFGLALYLRAKFDPCNPALTLPLTLIVPLIIFFIVILATGSNVDVARSQGWFFPILNYYGPGVNGQYDASYGSAALVNWPSVVANIPTMVLFWIVITLDVLLKIAGVRRALFATHLNFDHEMMLAGKANIITGLFVGTPGYNQPVLTTVNRSIVKNQFARIPGLIAVMLNFVLFAIGYPVVNFLPRFWLAGLVFYASLDFVVDNLLLSASRLNGREYVSVWLIVIINAIFGLGWAILTGLCISAFVFAAAYGNVGAIKAVNTAADLRSGVSRSIREDRMLQHLSKSCLVILLHRYIFFGSAAQIIDMIQGLVEEQKKLIIASRRLKYFLFDFTDVEDIDNTSMQVLVEAIAKIKGPDEDPTGVVVVFSGLSFRQRKIMTKAGVIAPLYEPEFRKAGKNSKFTSDDDEGSLIPIEQRRVFESLDLTLEWVEERLLERAFIARSRWFRVESFGRFHEDALAYARKDDDNVLGGGAKYFEKIDVPQGAILWRQGDFNSQLYFLQIGKLAAYGKDQKDSSAGAMIRKQSLRRGAFFNEESLYLETPVNNTLIAITDSTVLALSRESMKKLARDFPKIANEIHTSVLRHAARTRAIVARAREVVDVKKTAVETNMDSSVLNEGIQAGRRIAKQIAKGVGQTANFKLLNQQSEEENLDQKDVTEFMSKSSVETSSAVKKAYYSNRNKRMSAAKKKSAVNVSVTSTVRSLAAQNTIAASRHFSAVCKFDHLDERIKASWCEFVPEGIEAVLRASDICRALPGGATEAEAAEMIWEADLYERGVVTFFDILDTLATTYEGELLLAESEAHAGSMKERITESSFQIDADA